MIDLETVEDFYKKQFTSIPDHFKEEIGHFNIFKFDTVQQCGMKPAPYNIRAYYKICYIEGDNVVYAGDKTIHAKKQALLFGNPQVPYGWQHLSVEQAGYFCIFTASFFHHFGDPTKYPVFQKDAIPLIELTDDQANTVKNLFAGMYDDWSSNFQHRYDRMRVLIFEILHLAIKTQPVKNCQRNFSSASERIATQFLELLEQQFPIADMRLPLRLRSSSDFAEHLSIHVNHLNKVSQEVLHKPTSVIIQERILLEAKMLLKHTTKAVSEIAYDLGFKEKTHFNNFFKKYTQLSPSKYRII
jgi:AraC-like DNA-binding protein